MRHALKSWPEPFSNCWRGVKTAEFRLNDRRFCVGDELLLREWDPRKREYSGREILAVVTHVQRGGEFGIPADYVVLSLLLRQRCRVPFGTLKAVGE